MGESTTGTGRMILLHQCAETCKLLDGKYMMPDVKEIEIDKDTGKEKEHFGYSDKWSVVYGDTDSTYFHTHAQSPEQMIQIGDIIGDKVNDSFQGYMEKTFLASEGYSNKIKCARENISDRGIFVDKKMYILHIINSDGEDVDKMKVMGLRTKKTTLPKYIAKKLNGFVEQFLKGEEWHDIERLIVDYKDYLNSLEDPMKIGLPTGIKKIEAYELEYEIDNAVHLPGHIAAAVHYNECLKEFDDKVSMKIISGSKIKVFYLRQKRGRFKSIAIPVDIEQVPDWFLNGFEFEIDKEKHIDRLVDQPLKNILGAIGKKPPSKQQLLIDDCVEW